MSRKYELVMTSILASLAILFTLTKLEIPYFPVEFLKFDLAEIPSAVALLTLNLYSAIIVAIIHFVFLNSRSSFAPIGPLMKLLAVLSTVIGLYLVRKHLRKKGAISYLVILVPISIRVMIMELANILVITFILPGLLRIYGLTFYIIHVAIFNVLHAILTVLTSKVLVEYTHCLQKIYH